MPGWLEGLSALAVGGGSGIGRAVVDAFTAEGARVCVLERDPEKCDVLQEAGEDVAVVEGDATSASDAHRAVEMALERFGRLDTLLTFVGVFDYRTHLLDIPAARFDDAFREVFDVNVKTLLVAVRAAAPALAESRGSIVVTGSSSSFYPGRGGALYVASKFALRGLVLELAHELAPDVRVNGVAPGGTLDTDLRGLKSLGEHERSLGAQPGRAEAQKARTPLEVALDPADHVGAYVYLASGRARGVTGEIIRSDGGMIAR